MNREAVQEWAEKYRLAWENADSQAAAALFTEDGTYRDNIFQDPHRGRPGVVEYWSGVTAGQSDVTVRMGTPVVDGDRAVVEFWTTMTVAESPMTLAGALLLHFDEIGVCRSLHEYYLFKEGYSEPPEEWGA